MNRREPHIVKLFNGYAVRKEDDSGFRNGKWVYLDSKLDIWWDTDEAGLYCSFKTKEDAEKRIDGWIDLPGEEV